VIDGGRGAPLLRRAGTGVGTADSRCLETGPVRGRRVSVWLDVNLALGDGVTVGIERHLSAAMMMLSEDHRRADAQLTLPKQRLDLGPAAAGYREGQR
jgi:hypothetical protein